MIVSVAIPALLSNAQLVECTESYPLQRQNVLCCRCMLTHTARYGITNSLWIHNRNFFASKGSERAFSSDGTAAQQAGS